MTLGAFAGLRPIEVARLHWEDIDWGKGTIFIRPQTAKQVRRANTEGRFVTITGALRLWLEPIAGGKTDPVIPVKSKAMFRYKGLMERSAGIEIPADALRHSFATYRYALDGDASATARELGHASTDITFRHYARRDVTNHDAGRGSGSDRLGPRATSSRCAGRGEGTASTKSAKHLPRLPKHPRRIAPMGGASRLARHTDDGAVGKKFWYAGAGAADILGWTILERYSCASGKKD